MVCEGRRSSGSGAWWQQKERWWLLGVRGMDIAGDKGAWPSVSSRHLGGGQGTKSNIYVAIVAATQDRLCVLSLLAVLVPRSFCVLLLDVVRRQRGKTHQKSSTCQSVRRYLICDVMRLASTRSTLCEVIESPAQLISSFLFFLG
jgi:hypothetical protein